MACVAQVLKRTARRRARNTRHALRAVPHAPRRAARSAPRHALRAAPRAPRRATRPAPRRASRNTHTDAPRRAAPRLERVEVAVVDADDARAGVERDLHLALGRDLDERLDAVRRRAARRDQVAEPRARERRDDQQHRVRAVRARLRDLVPANNRTEPRTTTRRAFRRIEDDATRFVSSHRRPGGRADPRTRTPRAAVGSCRTEPRKLRPPLPPLNTRHDHHQTVVPTNRPRASTTDHTTYATHARDRRTRRR